jgi:hypothetical protein
MGRNTASFNQNVRKLKERGLTESLDIGYRLSSSRSRRRFRSVTVVTTGHAVTS